VRASSGQASIEWLGLLALLVVAVTLGLGVAMSQGVFVGRSVTRQMARALCVVGHGDCQRDREACTTASAGERQTATFSLMVVRLSGGSLALVERRSDGTIAITRAPQAALGLVATGGLAAKLRFAGFHATIGGEVQAAIMAGARTGRTWIASGPAQAADLLDRLDHARDSLPSPDIVYREGSLEESLGISASVDVAGIDLDGPRAEVSWNARVGSRVDHRTGHRTTYATAAWSGSVNAGTLWSAGDTGGGELYEVESDAAGRPLDLRVITTGPYRATTDLPSILSSEQGLIGVPATRGERAYLLTAHLDLTDPENLAAARGLVAALGRTKPHIGAPAAASAALRRRIDESGTIEAQVIERDDSQDGLGVSVTVDGLQLGADLERDRSSTRLLAAVSRGLDGQWLPRDDCVARAWLNQR
jgi:hypothetical protein